jgi:amino acid adenylation domain-containing protein
MIFDRLAAAAERRGEGLAVLDGERRLTYAELDERSNRLAAAMAAHGVGPGDRVGLALEKSLEAVVAIYGTLKAGAVYVPLDDQAPRRRLAYIVRDAGIRCLVGSEGRAGVCRALLADGVPLETVIGIDGERDMQPRAESDLPQPLAADSPQPLAPDSPQPLAADSPQPLAADLPQPLAPDSPHGVEPDGRAGVRWLPWSAVDAFPASSEPRPVEDPDALAYILYTSGSTGEPKGVMLSHANCLAFADWAAEEVGVEPEDRLSSHAPFHFDLSTFDLFAAVWGAATVVLVPRELSVFPVTLSKFIAERAITVWYSVPSALTALVLRGELQSTPLPKLRTIIFAGEVFPIKHLARLMELVGHCRYLNFYGPTETNVCTWHEVAREDLERGELPIGRPLPGVSASIVNAEGTPAGVSTSIVSGEGTPAGEDETGELVIGGPTVMHGYWGDPERTARVLKVDGSERSYMTGDLVRRRADGALLFGGRRDMQIKTRGYRVELGEVEAALNALDVVVEAAVIAVPDDTITNRLKAFVVTSSPIAAPALTRLCRDRLPPHMIPDEIEFRQELPKSSTGKIDRRALHQ